MSKKDLFKSQNPNKFLGSANLDKLKEDVESKNFIKEKVKQDKIFTPRADFSNPANFARYGLAEEYYRTSMESIYKTYPYDGSLGEKEAWYNSASYLDQYIYENEYPRTNGYIVIGDGNWGTTTVKEDYGLPSTLEYITFNGGPHGGFGSLSDPRSTNPAGERLGSLANKFKSAKNRENNLKVDLAEGVTVEFWMKKGGFDSALTKREVIFDLWNGAASSSADYGRFTLEMSASDLPEPDAPAFRVTCQSGTVGFFDQPLSTIATSSVADSSWHHYAFSFLSSSAGTITSTLYQDGQYVAQSELGTAFASIPLISTGMSASIGSLRTAPSGNVYFNTTMNGYGKVLSSSLDEFRYWKTERSAKQIFKNYNFQIGGGTNTDDANTALGVYYKFNEGITTDDAVDAVVLDYSGRVSNGEWVGYAAGSRNTGSAIVSSSASLKEFQDPIIYSFHPSVTSVKNRLISSGSFYDNQNNSALFYTMPSWIIEEDESYGGKNLRYLTQIMSSYLDTLYLQTEEITRLKEIGYTSGSIKPSIFGDRFLSDKGLLSPELFVDASVIEKLYDRNEKTIFERDLSEVKNKVYENIYNNLVQIYKSKGTYNSFRNALNTLGISQKVVDINLYANNTEYEILDNRKMSAERKKKLNLFKSDYNYATCYQATSSNSDSRGYIAETVNLENTPWTMESRFTIPKDNINSNFYFIENNILSCSLFGFHQPAAQNDTSHTWATNDNTVQAYAVRTNAANKDGYFYVSGAVDGTTHQFEFTSSVINNLFDDTEWNVSLSLKSSKWDQLNVVSGAAPGSETGIIELRGFSQRGGIIDNEFSVTQSMTYSGVAQRLFSVEKKAYIGAHRTNFTGSVVMPSFVKFSNLNFWFNYLSDGDLKSHLKDPKSFGITDAYLPAFKTTDGSAIGNYFSASINPLNVDTLAFRWDFETVTGSDASGEFSVDDTVNGTSGYERYGWFGAVVGKYQYTGIGYGFDANATDVVKTEKIQSHKLTSIDTVASDQMVQVRTEDDEVFLPDKRPIEYFFAAEKSFYGTINERIVETFSTLKDFNNLIGESANRYRPEYKELKKYRQLFFERVQNEIDFEKFIEYYKWVDSSISTIIAQLAPASAQISPELSNVIESHMLERNKYQHRLPVIKPMTAYEGVIFAGPNSSPLTLKGQISNRLQSENQVTSSNILTASLNIGPGASNLSELTGAIKNIVDLTYRNLNTSSYIAGSGNINTIDVTRTIPADKKGGNFSENTSVIIIPNKDGNNDFLQDPFYTVTPVADSFNVSGVVDYTIPTRPSQPSVITARFAAPGGPEVASLGYLDYESFQYSVYNSLNYRNQVVRFALDELRASSSQDPTLYENAASGSSYNKNYRNPRKDYVSGSEDGSYGTTSSISFDNAYINYAIPASDVQYSWITASYSSSAFLTRQSSSEDITWPRFLKDIPPSYGDEVMPVNIQGLAAAFLDARIFASILDNSDGIFPLVAKEEWSYPIAENLYSLFSIQDSIGTNGEYNPTSYPNNTNFSTLAGGTAGFGGSPGNNNEAVRYWFNSTAPYGFNPWNMLRNRDGKQLLRIFNKNNVLSVADPIVDKQIIDTVNGTRKRRTQKGLVANSVTNFIEPIITRKYKPLVHTFILNNQNNDKVRVKSSYAVRTAGFANKNLNELLDVGTKRKIKSYDKLKNLYLNSPDPANSSIKAWLSVEYSEMVWPKEKFQGVNSHRDKPHYDTYQYSQILYSRLGYMGNRTFWRNSVDRRKRSTASDGILGNAQNSLGTVYDSGVNTGDGTIVNGDNFSKNIFPLSDYSLADNSGSLGEVCQVQLVVGATITSSTAPLSIGFLDIDVAGTDENVKGSDIAGSAADAATSIITAINTSTDLSSCFTASSGGSAVVIVQTRYPIGISGSDYLGNNENTNYIDTKHFAGKITPNGKLYFSGGTAPTFNRDGELNSSFLANPGMETGSGIEEKFQGYREEGYFGTHGAASSHYKDGKGAGDRYAVKPTYSYYFPQASQTYIHRPRPAFNTSLVEIAPYSGHPWRVAQSSSRNPFFDSYEGFSKSPKFLTENYSIISEFNFSDHVKYYEDKGYNFRSINKKYFQIEGAKGKKDTAAAGQYFNTSSAASESGSYNAEFFKDYAYTELLQRFDAVQKDHKKVGQVGEITLTCKALQKFRPKQGFYPVQRCLQLGSLLSQSFDGQLSGTLTSSVKYGHELQQFRVQSAIQPLFSPGIMYNSIKSGLAVDWPVIFSGSLTTQANTDQLPSSSLLISSNASKRIPFEALSDLNEYPREVDVLYLYPSFHSGTVPGTNGARRPFFNWSGNRRSALYEHGMNNFLSEIPNFYLENKDYTYYTSEIEENFQPFESGSTYYMDVSLKQTNKHTMWRDYFDGTRANSLSYTGSYNGRAFGPGWNTSSAEPLGARIGADPSYAPYTPPYFYGESIARFSFAPSTSRKYTLDEIQAESRVEYLTPNLLTGLSGSNSTYEAISSTSPAYVNRMTLSSSFNLLGKIRTKPDSPDTAFNAWKIGPKFECPVLNFENQPAEDYTSRGMWGGLGTVSSGSEGIFTSIRNSFTGSVLDNTGSLADQLGFAKSQKKLGVLSSTTVLEEAVIAIPFLERKNKNASEAQVITIDNRNFFKADRKVLESQISSSADTTITNMAKLMDKYVIPPNYNFIKYKDITPFVMYVFEFSTTFSQQDLSYMWQGVMPDASLDGNEKFSEDSITHKTGPDEFFHGKEIPSDIRWLVFKVKKKARKDYSDVINLTGTGNEDYGFNWPYDFCSLVEMAKLDVGLKITPKPDLIKQGLLTGSILKGE